MSEVTIFIDDELLIKCQIYAERSDTSLNNLICNLLEEKVNQNSDAWLQELFDYADRKSGNSRGEKWKREDNYDR